jgi:sodium-independent sulfate anion transporter 11
MAKIFNRMMNDVRTDYTWNRVGRLAKQGIKATPTTAAHYALDKIPIIGWLPRYNYRWIVNDVIAGLTIGLMLIPQSLSYAKIATIPVEYGLNSSWVPPLLYTFMGSTKGRLSL